MHDDEYNSDNSLEKLIVELDQVMEAPSETEEAWMARVAKYRESQGTGTAITAEGELISGHSTRVSPSSKRKRTPSADKKNLFPSGSHDEASIVDTRPTPGHAVASPQKKIKRSHTMVQDASSVVRTQHVVPNPNAAIGRIGSSRPKPRSETNVEASSHRTGPQSQAFNSTSPLKPTEATGKRKATSYISNSKNKRARTALLSPPSSPIEGFSPIVLIPKDSSHVHAKPPPSVQSFTKVSKHATKKICDSPIKVAKPETGLKTKHAILILDDPSSAEEEEPTPSASSSKLMPLSKLPKALPAVDLIEDLSDIQNASSSDSATSKIISHKRKLKGVTTTAAAKEKPKNMSKKKEKPALITPVAFATNLMEARSTMKLKSNYLEGNRIFYIGGDMNYASKITQGRMEYIVQNGGILLPVYDPETVTHIVTDANVAPTLRALGLKALKDIPNHVPTVKWSWVIAGSGRRKQSRKVVGDAKGKGKAEEREARDNGVDVCLHAAFLARFEAGAEPLRKQAAKQQFKDMRSNLQDKGRSTSFVNDGDQDVSKISLFTQDKSPKVGDLGASAYPPIYVPAPDDPLAEFYDKARSIREENGANATNDEWSDSDPGSVVDSESESESRDRPARRGFACDSKELQNKDCPNKHIAAKLEELMELHKSKPGDENHWRAFSYSKCLRSIRNHPKPITSIGQALKIRGVGRKTALKIMEIVETGALRRIGHERTESVVAVKLFQGIYGVGQPTAYQLWAGGCRTLEDVEACKSGYKLSASQKIGIELYDDINDRMPQAEAQAIFDMIKPIALRLDPRLFVEIMGSFRRGKADCGDIDILITRPTDDGKSHIGITEKLIKELYAIGVITHDLATPDDWEDIEVSWKGLCRVPEKESARHRRIDILTVPWKSRGAALLYYTGDDIFNRAMRWKANRMGYSLNQKGLSHGVIRDPQDRTKKLCRGTIVASETEEEIFKILNIPWQLPHERVRG